jgi:hypothetical protein
MEVDIMVAKKKPTDAQKATARKEFYRIVKERLDSRLAKGEAYTSTKDLYMGYEPLHEEGFASTQFIAASVAQVMNHAEYRDKLFYARHVVTHKAERTGPGKSAPYKVYLRSDAKPPKDYVLVPISAKSREVAEYVAIARGSEDPTVHTKQNLPNTAPASKSVDMTLEAATVEHPSALSVQDVTTRLTRIIKVQAELIDEAIAIITMDQDVDIEAPLKENVA